VRCNKQAKRLWKQAELAKAQQASALFTATKFRTVVENDTGLCRQVEVKKRIKQWWFTNDSGKLALSVRYGARLLELAKGKFAIELSSEKELVPTLETTNAAVLAGELDGAMEVSPNKLRSGFQW
jgi:hypothetical protein